jgi:hypothetical protein
MAQFVLGLDDEGREIRLAQRGNPKLSLACHATAEVGQARRCDAPDPDCQGDNPFNAYLRLYKNLYKHLPAGASTPALVSRAPPEGARATNQGGQ